MLVKYGCDGPSLDRQSVIARSRFAIADRYRHRPADSSELVVSGLTEDCEEEREWTKKSSDL